MPEGRRLPWKFFPRQGTRLIVTFGASLLPAVVRATMASASASGMAPAPWCDDGEGREQRTGIPVKMDAEAGVKVCITLRCSCSTLWTSLVDRYLGIRSLV
jgi:hypothetical protein